MKFNLCQIPDEGMQRSSEVPAASLRRVVEAFGPQQSSVIFDLFVNQRGGNVEVTGNVRTMLQVPCNRCLEPAKYELDEEIAVTLAPQSRLDEKDEETSLSSGDLDVSFFDGEQINLLTLIEDEIMLLVPESVCDEDDEGRCMQCGKLTEELFRADESQAGNNPFAQLKKLIE